MRDLLIVVGFGLAYSSGVITGWLSGRCPKPNRIRIEVETYGDVMERLSEELRRVSG